MKQWTVASRPRPRGLSVNNEKNLIVSCREANKLQKYTTQGSLVREICLQAGVTNPWHAIQLLKYPSSLAVTKGDDILLVDDGNNGILSINSSLGSIQEQELSLSVDGGMQPGMVLYLEESRGRMYKLIAEREGKRRLLVFDRDTAT